MSELHIGMFGGVKTASAALGLEVWLRCTPCPLCPYLARRDEFRYAGKIRDIVRDGRARCALIEFDR